MTSTRPSTQLLLLVVLSVGALLEGLSVLILVFGVAGALLALLWPSARATEQSTSRDSTRQAVTWPSR